MNASLIKEPLTYQMNISMNWGTLPPVPKQYLGLHLALQPSTILLIRQVSRTELLPATSFKIHTRAGLQLILLNCRAWACRLFGPCCTFLSLFGIQCYKPTMDDATWATVVMLSAPFPDIFPSVAVTFTVKCHWTQSYGSDYYGKWETQGQIVLTEESAMENGSHPFMPRCLPAGAGLCEMEKGVQNRIDPLFSIVQEDKLIGNYSFIRLSGYDLFLI